MCREQIKPRSGFYWEGTLKEVHIEADTVFKYADRAAPEVTITSGTILYEYLPKPNCDEGQSNGTVTTVTVKH